MPECSYAKCDRDGSLVERIHQPTREAYWFCVRHDPLQDPKIDQFVEVGSDE